MVAPSLPVIIWAIGTIFTGVCALPSEQSRNLANNQLVAAKAKAKGDCNKNSCKLNYSTASGGKKFYHYSYEARGDHLDCKNLPKRKAIEKEVKSFAKSKDFHGLPYGCREKKIGKANWQIRISRNEAVYPIASLVC